MVSPDLQQRVEQFLYHEARLLDQRRFRDWFALLHEDLRYRMPLRRNRLRRESEGEFTGSDEAMYFDETRASIDQRIRRIETGFAWAEDPPSRTRHLVTNVTIETANEKEIALRAYFHIYRSRLERQVDQFVGERLDRLSVDASGDYRLLARDIHLDQATLLSNNLSVFF